MFESFRLWLYIANAEEVAAGEHLACRAPVHGYDVPWPCVRDVRT